MARMEDVLDLYAEPYDPKRPVVCFDETSTQLLAGTPPSGRTTSTGGRARAICFWPVSRWLAAGGGDPAAHDAGLRPSNALAGGRSLSRGPSGAGGTGQPLPSQGQALNTHRTASLAKDSKGAFLSFVGAQLAGVPGPSQGL